MSSSKTAATEQSDTLALERLRYLIPINSLHSRYQDELLRRMQVLEMKPGDFIFRQGQEDDDTWYLLEGVIEMEADGQLIKRLDGGSTDALHALAQLQPRQMSARAESRVRVVRFDRGLLSKLLALDSSEFADGAMPLAGSGDARSDDEGADWMGRMLQSELFARVPSANIQDVFDCMEALAVQEGDRIIQQGDSGEYYYVIQRGHCLVTHRADVDSTEIRLAELHPGDSFGEEALLANSRRNASVSMLTDGVLMRLTQEDFIRLIQTPVVRPLAYDEAMRRVADGACWLDVRFADEHRGPVLPDSINIPLNALRQRVGELDPARTYIVYSDSGERSATAAYLLSQSGVDAYLLEGGLEQLLLPDTLATGGTRAGSRPQATDIEVDVRAAVLQTEEARAEIKLQVARELEQERRRMHQQTEEARIMLEQAQRARAEIVDARAAAEAEAGQRIRQQELELERVRGEMRQRMQAEQQKLKQVYDQKARELAEVASMKQQAEALLQDTRRERRELDAARTRIQEHQRLEQAAEQRLRMERRRLEKEFARSTRILTEAQRQKAAAERARIAAREEAGRIITEFKASQRREFAEEKQRLIEEQDKLQREREHIRASLDDARQAREAAETARRAAEEKLRRLRQGITDGDGLQQEVADGQAEARHAQAELETAQSVERLAEQAHLSAEEKLERTCGEAAELRRLLEHDLQEWIAETERQESSTRERARREVHDENLERIQRQAEQALARSRSEQQRLLDDVASLLQGGV